MKKYVLFVFLILTTVLYSQEQYSIYFDTGKDTLNDVFSAEFKNWMDWHKSVNVTKIQGFADGVGKTDANSSLSMRRANYTVELLKANDVELDEKAEIKGLGEIGKDKDDAQSRKVIIYFEKNKPKVNPLEKQIKKAKVGSKIVLGKLAFERNSGKALPGSVTMLNGLVKIMEDNPTLKIDIQGHICCNLEDIKNLGQLRAKTVYNHLINAGIDKSRVSYQSFGGSRPIYPIPEQNAVEAEANRRVEIEIMSN